MSRYFFQSGWRDASVSVLLLALAGGLLLPNLFGPFHVYSALLLQAIFFLTSLRIDFRGVWQEFRSWKTLFWITLWMLVFLPLGVFLLVKPFFPILALPLLLLAAMPVGMTTPLLTQLLQLNTSLALALTLLTSLLAPFTVPLLVSILVGSEQRIIEIDHLFITLVQVIVVPFTLAQCARWIIPRWVGVTRNWHKPVSLFCVGLLIAAIAGRYHEALHARISVEYGLGLIVMSLFFLMVHFIGYWIVWWRSQEDRLTITFSLVYMNFTLAIFIAEKFFGDPTIIFYTILSILPWNIGMFIFQRWVIHK